MTTELEQPPAAEKKGLRLLSRAPGAYSVALTRLVLFWETFWPAILPVLAVPYAIIVISLFGGWKHTPMWLHWVTLLLAMGSFIAMGWRRLKELSFPSKRRAQARLESDGLTVHAPLQSLDDRPFESVFENPLWQAHREASAERARLARLAGVKGTATASDPYGLRFTAVGLFAIAIIAAGDDWRTRLASTLSPTDPRASLLVADVWIEPPDYTGKPPIYLLSAGEQQSGVAEQVNAPAGSILVAQINGPGRAQLTYTTDTDNSNARLERSRNSSRGELALQNSGLARLRLGGREISWPIGVLADHAPAVAFTDYPTATEEALLGFSYIAEDDYQLADIALILRLDPDQIRPLDSPAIDSQSLSDRRRIQLDGGGNPGERSAALDLQSDPWAGMSVLAKVVVTDGAGQTGETKEIAAELPTRTFFNPLAKTVIEQRQLLSVASSNWPRVGRAFDAVTMAPEVYFDNTTNYLLLRTAFWRVMRQDGDSFDDAVEKFWPLALQLEDEALELARQRLQAAEEALRQALERGASDEEIERLVEEMRQAMNDYLTALAQSGQAAGETPQNAQSLDQSDLDEMLNSIRDLAQSGAANAARQMLSDLQNMLNNLRLTQGGGGQGSGQPGEGEQGASGRTGEMIGRQRELADESFERSQNGRDGSDDLAAAERGLGSDLDDLIDELQGSTEDPDGDAARALGQARNDMRDAEQALSNGDFDAAADAMERAIDNMREGAEDLAREQMRQANQGDGGDNENAGGMDPLGRPSNNANGEGVDVPEESDASRTRAVINELRRRLGEPGRTKEEIEYLERLLQRF